MMVSVSRSEANVLTLARVAVGLVPAHDALRLLVTSLSPPDALGPSCRAALEDTLSRGLVLALGRQGGWFGPDGQRLWERVAGPPLHFTANTVRLLRWLVNAPLAEAEVPPLVFEGALTPAEEAVVTILIDALHGTGCEHSLLRQPALRPSALVTLAHAGPMGQVLALDEVPPFDVGRLALWVEGLRGLLARAWLRAEDDKGRLAEPAQLARFGAAQGRALSAFLAAIDQAGRRDLATFLIDAAVGWLVPGRSSDRLLAQPSASAPLRARSEARRASAAFLRALGTLRAWDEAHRAVRFMDDGYEVAQRLLKDWQRLGEAGFTRAAALVAELDALPATAASPGDAPRPSA
jgi:hypothetical protein